MLAADFVYLSCTILRKYVFSFLKRVYLSWMNVYYFAYMEAYNFKYYRKPLIFFSDIKVTFMRYTQLDWYVVCFMLYSFFLVNILRFFTSMPMIWPWPVNFLRDNVLAMICYPYLFLFFLLGRIVKTDVKFFPKYLVELIDKVIWD